MNRVAENLAPLLTCPAFYLWHLLVAVICIPALLHAWLSGDYDRGAFVAAFLLPACSACVLTSMQRDLLSSPVSFCLPGQRGALRRTSFLVGIITSLVASLPVLTHPGLAGVSLVLAVWSAFCFGLLVYLVVVASLFVVPTAMSCVGPAMAVSFALVNFVDFRILVQEMAIFAPGWNTMVLAILASVMWRRMGGVAFGRRICGSRFLSLQMIWRRSATEEFGGSAKRHSLSKGTWSVRRRLLELLFARISRRPPLSFRRHLAAAQYELAGRLVPLSPGLIVFIAFVILSLMVLAGYAPLREDRMMAPEANGVYLLSLFLGMHLFVPVFPEMLLSTCRRQRFWNTLTISLGHGAVVFLISVFFYVLLLGMDWLAPPLSIGVRVHDFRPAEWWPSFVPLALVPLSLALKVVCKKWLLIPEIILFSIGAIALFNGGVPLGELSTPAIVVLVSVIWAILAGVLYTYSFHRDLVRE